MSQPNLHLETRMINAPHTPKIIKRTLDPEQPFAESPEKDEIAQIATYKMADPPNPNDDHWWTKMSTVATCCCWISCLNAFSIRGENVQQAWREKVEKD